MQREIRSFFYEKGLIRWLATMQAYISKSKSKAFSLLYTTSLNNNKSPELSAAYCHYKYIISFNLIPTTIYLLTIRVI